MVTYVKHDLAFILGQTIIAEQHAALSQGLSIEDSRNVLLSLIPNSRSFFGLRTVDGSLNNLVPGQLDFGAGGGNAVAFPRRIEPNYRDEMDEDPFGPMTNTDYAVSGNVVDADPRINSDLIVNQTTDNFAAVAAMVDNAGSSVVVSPNLEWRELCRFF